jgi:hypothetical protein
VVRNNLTVGSDSDLSSYSTDSITPGPNRLVLAFVMSASAVNEQPTAQNNNGLTWVPVKTVQVSQGGRLTCFRSLGAAPTSGPITFDFDGNNQDFCAWSVFEYDGVDITGTSGSGAVVQSSETSIISGVNLSIALNPLADPANSTIVGALVLSQDTQVTPGTGFNPIHQEGGLQTQDRIGGQTVNWTWQDAANAAAIALEIRAAVVVIPSGPDEGRDAKLARRFEPILFFHKDEKFFPSDAKRYIEKCALWKSQAPFDVKNSWGGMGGPFPRNPLIGYGKIAPIQGEAGVFLSSQLVDTKTEERFLDLAGWKDATGMDEPKVTGASKNHYSNRDAIAARYALGGDLESSKFWYHAEFFTHERLRDDLLPTVPAPDLLPDFTSLKNASLLNYYFFFPAHQESLAASCTNIEGKEFGSFGGEWACVAVLLEETASEPFSPLCIGYTGRRLTTIPAQAPDEGDEARRCVMKVSPFAEALDAQTGEHPRLFVAKSTHSLYLRPGIVTVDAYPAESAPHNCGRFDGPHTFQAADAGVATASFIIVGKLLAAGLIPLNVAGYLKVAAGIAAIIAELENATWGDPFAPVASLDQGAPDETAQPGSGKVVLPKDLTAQSRNRGSLRAAWIPIIRGMTLWSTGSSNRGGRPIPAREAIRGAGGRG